MMETQQAASLNEETAQLMAEATGREVDNVGEERRAVPQLYIGFPQVRNVSVKVFRDEQQGLNEAEIVLPIEKVQRLTRALIEHPILLPTGYSQSSSTEDGKHVLKLTSVEAFQGFIERLTDALGSLSGKRDKKQ